MHVPFLNKLVIVIVALVIVADGQHHRDADKPYHSEPVPYHSEQW